MAKLITTTRGGRCLAVDGFVYHKQISRQSRTYWHCAQRKEFCRGRAVSTNNPLTVVKQTTHNHAPNQDAVAAREVVNNLRGLAAERPDAAPTLILRDELSQVTSVVTAQLPLRSSLRRTMNRRRQAELPPNPANPQELNIPPEYRTTLKNEPFLLYENLDDDDASTILIFASDRNLRVLGASQTWFMDGTFKVTPIIFHQLFTIHGMIEDSAFPLVYALVENKEEETYYQVLREVVAHCNARGINIAAPDTLISDFEKAIINAGRRMFPNAQVRLCFYHLGQSSYRKVQELGLQAAYINPENRELKIAVHCMLSVAFVPPDDVEEVFDALAETLPDNLQDLADYFERVYIKGIRRRRGRRTPPQYAPALWNQFEAIANNEPRTNNLTEGWHHRFNDLVGKNHPSFYHFLRELRKENDDVENMIMEVEMGRTVKMPQRSKYRRVNERLHRLAGRYEAMKTAGRQLDYLRACAHNFDL